MKNTMRFLATALLISLSACAEKHDDKLLIGSWTAFEFIENNEPQNVDLKAINFEFYNNQTYNFQGLSNRESGNFHVQGDLLYSTDTLASERIEKSVRIIKLNSDSLFFEMNLAGKKQIMKLRKNR